MAEYPFFLYPCGGVHQVTTQKCLIDVMFLTHPPMIMSSIVLEKGYMTIQLSIKGLLLKPTYPHRQFNVLLPQLNLQQSFVVA